MDLVRTLSELPHTPELGFNLQEYEHRCSRLREQMAIKGFDALIVSNPANLAYLTGYDSALAAGLAIGVFTADGDISLHCSECEATGALQNSTIRDVHLFQWHTGGTAGASLGPWLHSIGFDGKRIGAEIRNPETFTRYALDADTYIHLSKALPNATLIDASDLVLDLRVVKSAAEIAHMRKAAIYTVTGMNAALEAVADGVSDNLCMATAYQALFASGSEPPAINPLIMSGERTGWIPHAPQRRDVMRSGDAVFLEMSGAHLRYHAPLMRTASIGAPDDTLRRVADVSIETVQLTLENIRPGRTGHDVAMACGGPLNRNPDIFSFGSYGYSVGLGFSPSWSEASMYLAEGIERELEPGMCFHVATCIFIPGRVGVGFSHSVAVTDTGCEILTSAAPLTLRNQPA